MADHLIAEVDEALRKERLQSVWQRFGQYAVGMSVAVIIVTVAIVIWQNYNIGRQESLSGELIEAESFIADGKDKEALEVLELLMEKPERDISAIARLIAVQIMTRSGDVDGARKLLDDYEPGDTVSVYGDIMSLYSAAIGGNDKSHDIVVSDDSFSLLLKEFEAVKMMSSDPKKAESILESIKNNALAPRAQKARVELVLTTISK